MTLSSYLTFDGDCADAFQFYKSVFGGDFSAWMTFAEGPPEMGVADNEKSRIMHVSLPVGGSVLMGSDKTSGLGDPLNAGNNFSIHYAAASNEDADAIFAKLSDGGAVTMPMEKTFWNAYFGMCRDKFGVNWMVDHELGDGGAS